MIMIHRTSIITFGGIMGEVIKNIVISIMIQSLNIALCITSPIKKSKRVVLPIHDGSPIGKQLLELNRNETIKFLKRCNITILKEFIHPNSAIIIDKKGMLALLFSRKKQRGSLLFDVQLKIGNQKTHAIIQNALQARMLKLFLHVKLQVIQIQVYKNFTADGSSKTYGVEFGQKIQIGRITKDNCLLTAFKEKVFPAFDMDKGHYFDTLVPIDDVTFPIDVVYTWVDGNDPKWIERKNKKLASLGYSLPETSIGRSRWENRDELRFSLRSLNMFAPWIRNVYIVTDNQRPSWLKADHQQYNLFIIDHTDIFPDLSSLPVYNSHAIESVLHRIKGLSDYFIYMNDDVFLGKNTFPETFFTSGGLTKVFFASKPMPLRTPEHCQKATEWGGINSSSLLIEDYNRYISRKIEHTPIILHRDTLFELEEHYKAQFELTRNTPFRRHTDISVLTALYLNYGIITGKAFSSDIEFENINISNQDFKRKSKSYLKKDELPKTFCLNDTVEVEDKLSWKEQSRITSILLNHFYPWKSMWES
jgi:hypothetical protein